MKVRSIVLGCGGVLLLLCAPAHFLGWAQFDVALVGVESDAAGGLHIGWVWGSACFAALGAVALGAAVGWRRRGRDPRPAALPVALALLVFGSWALFAHGFSPHFLGFLAIGLLIGAPLLGRIETRTGAG